mgnify:CR=1 FL=1
MVPLMLLTPVSRHENLERITASVGPLVEKFDCNWMTFSDSPRYARPGSSSHPRIDPSKHYGKPILNEMLDRLRDWGQSAMIGFLDDDTIVPESLADAYTEFLKHYPDKKAFTVQQVNKDGTMRIDVRARWNRCRIDQGCYFIHTDLIGSHRFFAEAGADATLFYGADGEFYHRIRKETSIYWIDLPIIGSIYNALR